jgi:hypothetical protein
MSSDVSKEHIASIIRALLTTRFHAGFFLGLLLEPEGISDMFL